jgi:Leucine-rich repeat (LRR) protein
MMIKNLKNAKENAQQVTTAKLEIKNESELNELPFFPNCLNLYLTVSAQVPAESLELFFAKLNFFSSLKVLYLSSESLTFLNLLHAPETLQFLNVKNCQINKVQTSQKIRLKELNLSSNKLSSLPQGIGQFTFLERLNLASNNLNSLDEEILFLQQLHHLVLDDNSLTQFPAIVTKLPQLKTLSLEKNPLSLEERERMYQDYKMWFE